MVLSRFIPKRLKPPEYLPILCLLILNSQKGSPLGQEGFMCAQGVASDLCSSGEGRKRDVVGWVSVKKVIP